VGLLTDASAADVGWAAVPLQRLHGDAAAAALASVRAQVHTGAAVRSVAPAGGRWSVRTADREFQADDVILAVPAGAAMRVAPAAVRPVAAASAELGTSPIVNLHVVLDRPVLDVPFVAGVGTPVQWIFDRTEQSGLPGAGQYLAVSLSAADAYVDRPVAELRERFLPEMAALLPAMRGAVVTDFFVTRERDATWRPSPGSASVRPGAATAAPGLLLAGAWTDTGWPATMEGAVRSGDTAAALVGRPVRQGVGQ
jgi:monoamine oxidase